MPHPVKLTLAIGPPIKVPKPAEAGKEPPPELVEKVHAQYVEAVHALFEAHKESAGYGDRQLNIVSANPRKEKKSQ